MQTEILQIIKNIAKETGFDSDSEEQLIEYSKVLCSFIINYNINYPSYLEWYDKKDYYKEQMIKLFGLDK